MGAGLTLLRQWASAGLQIKPSDAKIDLGWVAGEQPAVEWENERMATRDALTNDIVTYLNTGVPFDDLIEGDALVVDSSIRISDSASAVNLNSYLNANGLVVAETGISVSVKQDQINLVNANAGKGDLTIRNDGIEYTGGYGDLQSTQYRWEGYNFSNLTFVGTPYFGADGDWWQLQRSFDVQNFVLSNIPVNLPLISASMTYTDTAGDVQTSPVHLTDQYDNGGFHAFGIELITNTPAPDANETIKLYIQIDVFNV